MRSSSIVTLRAAASASLVAPCPYPQPHTLNLVASLPAPPLYVFSSLLALIANAAIKKMACWKSMLKIYFC
jgi:hypothetical protein